MSFRSRQADGPSSPRDGLREAIETIVIVIALVLLLKIFVAEAFVIPTGSMATTLLGSQFSLCGRHGLPGAPSERAHSE
jgi:signal peptidase I